jgi:hypothetical protein
VDGLINGERSVLRIVPRQRAAVVPMTNSSNGRAMYRSLFADLMTSLCEIALPPLRLDPSPSAAGDLSRFAGIYAWPDRQVEVTATANGLLMSSEAGQTEALPLDDRAFLVDPPIRTTRRCSGRSTEPDSQGCSTTCCRDFRVPTDDRTPRAQGLRAAGPGPDQRAYDLGRRTSRRVTRCTST